MLKRLILVVGMMFIGNVGIAQALPFTDVVNFWSSGSYKGADYQEISGSIWTWNTPFIYQHTLDLDPPGIVLNSATLSLTHIGNSNFWFFVPLEVWFTRSGEDRFIGLLSRSPLTGEWVTDTWPLSSDVLNEITSTTPWSLEVKAQNIGFIPNGKLWLDKSVLEGDYTPIPEPASLALLGLGLLGLFSAKRKA